MLKNKYDPPEQVSKEYAMNLLMESLRKRAKKAVSKPEKNQKQKS